MTEQCAYCGEEFDSEHEEGVHRAEQHVDTESNIAKSKRMHDARKNIIEDEWETDERGESA